MDYDSCCAKFQDKLKFLFACSLATFLGGPNGIQERQLEISLVAEVPELAFALAFTITFFFELDNL